MFDDGPEAVNQRTKNNIRKLMSSNKFPSTHQELASRQQRCHRRHADESDTNPTPHGKRKALLVLTQLPCDFGERKS